MSEDLNLKLSQFIDNELEHDEALKLLNALADQPHLQHKLKRYEAISHAIKSQVYLEVKADFSANIAQQIKQDALPFIDKKQAFKQTYQWLALAASIAIIAFIVEQGINNQRFNSTATLPKDSDLNKRIGQYLQDHSPDAYANGEIDAKPYAKVTIVNPK
jgi:sigma-E factor negative regulatory protein RseA